MLYLLSPATLALASYSMLVFFKAYILYVAAKETYFFTVVVFKDLGYMALMAKKSEAFGSKWTSEIWLISQ